jgi:LEA14-like dessication related protein
LCLLLAAATLTLSGCNTIARNLNIVNPTYSIRDLRPRVNVALPLSASSIDFDLTLGVNNPNPVGLRLNRVDFDMLVNDNPVLTSVSRDPRITIPARGVGDVHMTMRAGYDSLRNIFREVTDLIQGNRARYSLRGNAYYDTPVGRCASR